MAKNHMPVAHFGVRPDHVRAECAPPKAFEKWQPELRAKAEAAGAGSGPFVIDVMDVIGESWDGYGITGRRVGALLRAAGEREVVVNINSPGGDVFEGLAIYNMLRGHTGDVTVRIVGLAASAASVIAMAGDRIEIARAGFLMIHNTWVMAVGDRNDLETVAGQLAAFDEVLAEIYSLRARKNSVQEFSRMMDKETWISGSSAIENGLADELLAADQVEAAAQPKAEASHLLEMRELESVLAAGGASRAKRRAMIKALTAKPSAGEDDKPSAVETMADLTGWAKSLTAKMEN
ncbi:prophage Clp protease-like protein [Paracoccus yeei]|uniref:ATP-dependent Clp protease proteolytic subunit n=1 Tax=Paracoccus yeei TaxID=147645 RepID=A0A386ULS7_9RHOB|nr:head maturation protease, ClpP-related [Paracoccus yeei]AYF01279.1 prophage Clp protease-like protein [Paracoccus yeei]